MLMRQAKIGTDNVIRCVIRLSRDSSIQQWTRPFSKESYLVEATQRYNFPITEAARIWLFKYSWTINIWWNVEL